MIGEKQEQSKNKNRAYAHFGKKRAKAALSGQAGCSFAASVTQITASHVDPCSPSKTASSECWLREGDAMNSTGKISAAVIGSFVLGVGAANVLHAQTKPPAFVFVEIDVKDQDGYTKDFLPKAQANIKEGGGKYLAGGFNKAVSLTGSPPPNRVILLQFSDMDAVKAFYAKEQQLEADDGNKYASFRAIGIEGIQPK
jgi:uncharacterized protein (DUF1330 family)